MHSTLGNYNPISGHPRPQCQTDQPISGWLTSQCQTDQSISGWLPPRCQTDQPISGQLQPQGQTNQSISVWLRPLDQTNQPISGHLRPQCQTDQPISGRFRPHRHNIAQHNLRSTMTTNNLWRRLREVIQTTSPSDLAVCSLAQTHIYVLRRLHRDIPCRHSGEQVRCSCGF